MKASLFLLFNLIFYNVGFLQNAYGKFILVEVAKKENAIAKSGSGKVFWNTNFHLEKYLPVNL